MSPVIRKRLFVGCEGNGERALVTALQRLANEVGLPIHLDPFNAHGGSPVAILQNSVKEARSKAAKRGKYDGGLFAMLDKDRVDADACFPTIQKIAARHKITLIIHDSRLECFLGRMLTGRYDYGPDKACAELMRIWPAYSRSFDASELLAKLNAEQIRRSGQACVGWAELLKRAGF